MERSLVVTGRMDASWIRRTWVATAVACLVALTTAACGRSDPSRTAPTAIAAATTIPSMTAEAMPACTLPMLTFALAPWEGAMGTAYSGILIGLTSGLDACSLRGALQVAVTGSAAPAIAADGKVLPADLVLRQEPLDPASPRPGQAVVRVAFRNWCPDRPADGALQVQIVPLGVSPPLATTFPTPACTTPGEPARLEVGPINDGAP